jgi:hypothetical protein
LLHGLPSHGIKPYVQTKEEAAVPHNLSAGLIALLQEP